MSQNVMLLLKNSPLTSYISPMCCNIAAVKYDVIAVTHIRVLT